MTKVDREGASSEEKTIAFQLLETKMAELEKS